MGTRAKIETREDTYVFLTSLLLCNTTRVMNLVLLTVSAQGVVGILHSLFLVPGEEYNNPLYPPILWAILREIPASRMPRLYIISPLDFASNNVFYGTSEEEFELHVIRLTSILPRNLNFTVQQVSLKEDDGARLVTSRGLMFLSKHGGQHVLELGGGVCLLLQRS